MLAVRLDSRHAGVQKLHDLDLLLHGASLAHVFPATACAKKHSDLIGSILAGSGPNPPAPVLVLMT